MLLAVRISSYGYTWEVWRALKKLELHMAIASCNSYASFVISKLPLASITWYTQAKHEQILNYYPILRGKVELYLFLSTHCEWESFFCRFFQSCQQRLRSTWALFICSRLCLVNLLARSLVSWRSLLPRCLPGVWGRAGERTPNQYWQNTPDVRAIWTVITFYEFIQLHFGKTARQ